MTNVSKAMEYAATFEREAMREKLDKQPTKIFGPNLEGTLNAAGFYRKKEWVGLTDEDILDIVGRAGAGYPAVVPPYTRDLFKKIEDKLREKNG